DRRDRARVEAAAQVRPDRHVAHELAGDGGGESLAQLVLGVVADLRNEVVVPEATYPWLPALDVDGEQAPRREEPDAVEEGQVREDVLKGEVLAEGLRADGRREARMAEQRLHLRAEEQHAAA